MIGKMLGEQNCISGAEVSAAGDSSLLTSEGFGASNIGENKVKVQMGKGQHLPGKADCLEIQCPKIWMCSNASGHADVHASAGFESGCDQAQRNW